MSQVVFDAEPAPQRRVFHEPQVGYERREKSVLKRKYEHPHIEWEWGVSHEIREEGAAGNRDATPHALSTLISESFSHRCVKTAPKTVHSLVGQDIRDS